MAERLPDNYGAMLRQAALTPNTRADPFACDRAIEEAIERVKTAFPHFFNNTGEDENET